MANSAKAERAIRAVPTAYLKAHPASRPELDDMFLFERGWAFTSVSPRIGKEPLGK